MPHSWAEQSWWDSILSTEGRLDLGRIPARGGGSGTGGKVARGPQGTAMRGLCLSNEAWPCLEHALSSQTQD